MFTKTVNKEPLIIRALQWASDRGSVGFELTELKTAIAEDEGEWEWIRRMMLGEINGNTPFIYHLGRMNQEGKWIYFLTNSGAIALMDYFELKEARDSSRRATYIAIGSLIIATLVGIAQIVVQVVYQ